MDAVTAHARLSAMTHAALDPVLTEDQLAELLVLAAIADADGREPAHAEWVPTYSLILLRDAAAEGWRIKASIVAARPEQVSADDATVRRGSALYQHCLGMAASYASRSVNAVGEVQLRTHDPVLAGIVVGNAPEPDDLGSGPAGSWPENRGHP